MRLRNIPRAESVINNHKFVLRKPKEQKNKWLKIFGNNNPIHIEIGMGKGQFILEKARKNQGINYIGIERYSSVLLRALERLDNEVSSNTQEGGGKDIIVGGLKNLRLIRMDAVEIEEVFGEMEIEKVYLNFSDPWPKKRNAKRRLTSKEFLRRYEKVLSNNGRIELKTDNVNLFDFSIEQLDDRNWNIEHITKDLHHDEAMNVDNIMTEYEEKFSLLGNPIYMLIAKKASDYHGFDSPIFYGNKS